MRKICDMTVNDKDCTMLTQMCEEQQFVENEAVIIGCKDDMVDLVADSALNVMPKTLNERCFETSKMSSLS